MDTRIFLRRMLPDQGFYVLFCRSRELKTHRQKSFRDIDELADAAKRADAEGWDTYFALSNFEKEDTRKAVFSKQLKCFFLDLDCGPSKPHATKKDALRDLIAFCKKTKLPQPLTVDSGRGLHVYWPLEEPVDYIDWKPVAESFKKLCKTSKFEIDTAVPADAARVLRILHTHNHKPVPPAPVSLIGSDVESISLAKFSDLVGTIPITVPTRASVVNDREDGDPQAFAAFIQNTREYLFKNILAKTQAGKGCEQLRLIMTDQENTTEPMWRAGLSIAKFCADGDKAAHVLSKKHPEYMPHLTEQKMDLVKGPYRCSTFDENNPHVCTDCPHWGKLKSPIVLGGQFKEFNRGEDDDESQESTSPSSIDDVASSSEHVIPSYPAPFFRGRDGGVFIRKTNAEGDVDEFMVYHNDIYVTRRMHDIEAGESIVVCLHLPKDGVREFTMPLRSLTSREEFRKAMAGAGVAQIDTSGLMEYMTKWVNELQARHTADIAHRQYGWTSDECKSFVVGDKEISATKVSYNPPTPPTALSFPCFKSKGTLEGWSEMANFYMKKPNMELHQYIVCTTFGSPLMQFLPQNCSTLHTYDSDGGGGKSSAMKVAASAWGHYKGCMLDEKDTMAYKMNRGEVLHNLPFYIDELTNVRGEDLSDLAYQLTSGEQRGRMSQNSNIERPRGVPWKLLCCTSANASIIERISTIKEVPRAEAQRILEFRASKVFTKSEEKELTDDFEAKIEKHYGHAGEVFIMHVMRNLETVDNFLRQVQKRVDRVAKLKAENRYWSAGVACALTGGVIAKKLGLIDYDMEALFKWTIKLLKNSQSKIEDMGSSVEQTLNDYVMEHYGNVLWIKSTDDLRKTNNAIGNGLDDHVVPDRQPNTKLVARYETDTKRLFLSTTPLKNWCGARQINYAAFVDELKKNLDGKRVKQRLGKGTRMGGFNAWCISVNCSLDVEGEGIEQAE